MLFNFFYTYIFFFYGSSNYIWCTYFVYPNIISICSDINILKSDNSLFYKSACKQNYSKFLYFILEFVYLIFYFLDMYKFEFRNY